jgi:hypothetical protein
MFLQGQDHQRFLPAVQTVIAYMGMKYPLEFCEDASIRLRCALAPFDGWRQHGDGDFEFVNGHQGSYVMMEDGRWTVDA